MPKTIAVVLLATGSTYGIDIGDATLDIKSGGQDVVTIPLGTPSLDVEVYFSATTAGADGPNHGVEAVVFDLIGTALGDNTGNTSVLNPLLTTPLVLNGLGFAALSHTGTGAASGIFGVFAAQGVINTDFENVIHPFTGHPAGSHPIDGDDSWPLDPGSVLSAGVGPVLMATATLVLDVPTPGVYTVEAGGDDGINLWVSGGGRTNTIYDVSDTLTVNVAPEPAALLLVALASPIIMGRRQRQPR